MENVLAGSPDDLIRASDLARLLGKAPATLATWRTRGFGPEFLKIGASVFYQRGDVVAWLKARRVKSAAAGRLVNARAAGSRSKIAAGAADREG